MVNIIKEEIEIKDYLEFTKSTTSDIRSTNQIDSILNKYEDVIDDLYYKDILNDKDIDIIQNNHKIKDKKIEDFER